MPTINGRTYEFAAGTFVGGGATIASLDSAQYAASRDVEMFNDVNGAPLHWALGEFNPDDPSFEFAKSDLEDFLNGVEDAAGGGKLGGRFTWTISYADTDQPEATDTLDLLLVSIENTVRRSDKKAMVQITGKYATVPDFQGIELMPAASGGSSGGGGGRQDPRRFGQPR